MRVLYVLERYPELSQTFVEQELIGLSEMGIEVEVASLEAGSAGSASARSTIAASIPARARVLDGVRAAGRAPARTLSQLVTETSWPPPGGSRRVRGFFRIAPFVEPARRADHIHAHFATEAADIARLLSALSGTPWSFSAHANDAYGDPYALGRNLGSAEFARACSSHVRERLEAADPSLRSKVVELPIAVDVDRFGTCTGPVDDGPLITVGRLVEKKGFDDLITAIATAKDDLGGRRLLVIGDGPLRASLEAQARSTGAPVEFLGAVPNDEIPNFMSSASAFVLTPRTASDGDRDGRPAAIVEAMASGLPIVSTTQPGIPELVTPSTGLLATPGDADTIAEAFRSLFAREVSERRTMGTAGRAAVIGAYGRTAVAQRLSELFEASRSGPVDGAQLRGLAN